MISKVVSTALFCFMSHILRGEAHFSGGEPLTDAESSNVTNIEIIDSDIYEIPIDEAQREAERLGLSAMEIRQGFQPEKHLVATNFPNARQKKIWDLVNSFDDYRTSALWKNVDGRITLSTLKYVILPIWWSEEEGDSSFDVDNSQIQTTYDKNAQYYKDMSWNKMSVTYEIATQTAIEISKSNPNMSDVSKKTKEKVEELGYEEGVNYNGVSVAYWKAENGNLANGGGWASVNGLFTWMTYPHSYAVLRHEIGHNAGHPHHKKDSYKYRNTRPSLSESHGYDGFDMMSGGNGYDISDFAAASKWFFNWIPDSSVIHMQPEGSTSDCSSCLSSGSFILFSFDDKNVAPTPEKPMGIHIPITAIGNKLYSYWLSYRGAGVKGKAAHGLSVHLSWFSLGGVFGAAYDSTNYDAFGDTDNMFDSFVEVDSCYHVFPNAYMKDRKFGDIESVQPVVCVESIDQGTSISVNVTFLDPENPPTPPPINTLSLTCSSSVSSTSLQKLSADKYNLIHVESTGFDGEVELHMCSDGTGGADIKSTAFLYDSYPHSPITYESKHSYGSYKSLTSSALSCCEPDSVLEASGAKVVVIKQNKNDHLHFNEIEIYDESGQNVALSGKCFSSSIGWGGDPNCLNDGLTGIDACGSHTSSASIDNFEYCVLNESIDVKRVKIYPRFSWKSRVNNIQLVLYADVIGSGSDAQFLGEMASYQLLDAFDDYQPHEEIVNLLTTLVCPNKDDDPMNSISYLSDYGNNYILIPPSTGSGVTASTKTSIEVTCKFTECLQNSYLSDDTCTKCPPNSMSPKGSTSESSCTKCLWGFELQHEMDSECALSESYKEIISSKGWRIWATNYHTMSWWSWDIDEIEFYSSVDCDLDKIDDNLGTAIDSGNGGSYWAPEKAFGKSGIWGGRRDSDDLFYIGKTFTEEVVLRCLKITSTTGDKSASEIRVQAFNEKENSWENAWIAKGLDTSDDATNTIPILYPTPSEVPTSLPSMVPSMTRVDPNASSIPSSAPSRTKKKVQSRTPCKSTFSGMSANDIPQEPTERGKVIGALERVIVKASGSKKCEISSFSRRLSFSSSSVSSLEVIFDLINDVVCDGDDCAAALNQAVEVAQAAANTLADAVADGSIDTLLQETATELAVPILAAVTVDPDSLETETPELQVVTPVPTKSPTTADNAAPTTAPSTPSLLNSVFTLLRSILEFLIALLNIF